MLKISPIANTPEEADYQSGFILPRALRNRAGLPWKTRRRSLITFLRFLISIIRSQKLTSWLSMNL